jgi:hypothetical protein
MSAPMTTIPAGNDYIYYNMALPHSLHYVNLAATSLGGRDSCFWKSKQLSRYDRLLSGTFTVNSLRSTGVGPSKKPIN